MDEMGSYVPNTSRRVLGILLLFFAGGEAPASQLPRVFFHDFQWLFFVVEASASQLPRVLFFLRFSVFSFLFDQIFFEIYFLDHFSFLRHRTLCPEHMCGSIILSSPAGGEADIKVFKQRT